MAALKVVVMDRAACIVHHLYDANGHFGNPETMEQNEWKYKKRHNNQIPDVHVEKGGKIVRDQ